MLGKKLIGQDNVLFVVFLFFIGLVYLLNSPDISEPTGMAVSFVDTSVDSCPSDHIVFRMSSVTNAHAAEFDTESTDIYPIALCSDWAIGGHEPDGFNTVIRLSSEENAHAEDPTFSTPGYQDVYFGNVRECYVTDNVNCGVDEVCFASLSSATNAHVGDCNAYGNKLCCKQGCSIIDLYWSSWGQDDAPLEGDELILFDRGPEETDGDLVGLFINATDTCSEKNLTLQIWEKDISIPIIDPQTDDLIRNFEIVFGEKMPGNLSRTKQLWNVIYQPDDQLWGGGPEYFFGANFTADGVSVAVNASRDNDDLLIVLQDDPLCGNGEIDYNPPEECDIGEDGTPHTGDDVIPGGVKYCNETVGWDACPATDGVISCGLGCSLFTDNCCPVPAVCGNGVREPGELCDDNDLDGKSCSDFDEFDSSGSLSCFGIDDPNPCHFDTSSCGGGVPGVCGDEVINAGEECDCGSDSCALGELNDMSCADLDEFADGTLSCFDPGGQSECFFDVSGCNLPLPGCGNGFIDLNVGETCDFTPGGIIFFDALVVTDGCSLINPSWEGDLDCFVNGTENECRVDYSACSTPGPGEGGGRSCGSCYDCDEDGSYGGDDGSECSFDECRNRCGGAGACFYDPNGIILQIGNECLRCADLEKCDDYQYADDCNYGFGGICEFTSKGDALLGKDCEWVAGEGRCRENLDCSWNCDGVYEPECRSDGYRYKITGAECILIDWLYKETGDDPPTPEQEPSYSYYMDCQAKQPTLPGKILCGGDMEETFPVFTNLNLFLVVFLLVGYYVILLRKRAN